MLNNNLIIAFIKNILAAKYDIRSEKVKGVYLYGSRLYGVADEKSDYDYIVIVDMIKNDYLQYESKELDIHVISESYYKKLLDKHSIMALEVYYHSKDFLQDYFEFNLSLDTLRRKISAVVSNSWAKARKKLDIPEEDDYLGLKSLFHSIRILSYGIDIARDGNIDFKNVLINPDSREKISCSNLWNRILQKYESGWRWVEFKKKYTPLQNSNATLFRLLAPKIH